MEWVIVDEIYFPLTEADRYEEMLKGAGKTYRRFDNGKRAVFYVWEEIPRS